MDYSTLADSLINGFLYGVLCGQKLCVKRTRPPAWEAVLLFLALAGIHLAMTLLNLPAAAEPASVLIALCCFSLACKIPVRSAAGLLLLVFILHFGFHTISGNILLLVDDAFVAWAFLLLEILAVAALSASKWMNQVFRLEKEPHFIKAELLFLGLFALNRLLAYTQGDPAVELILTISGLITAVLFYLWIWRELRCQSRERCLNESLVAERHRNRPLRLAMEAMAGLSTETAVEFRPELERLEKEHRDQQVKEWQKNSPAPETGILLLDGLLRQFLKRAEEDQILFQTMIREPPSLLISECGIGLDGLLRSIGDLLFNAFEAVDRQDPERDRMILLCMGKTGSGVYEIDLLDSGVPFTEEVWEKLGQRGNTTEGTGCGMADLLETLREWRASLTLQEYPDSLYTKKLTVSFGGEYALYRVPKEKK